MAIVLHNALLVDLDPISVEPGELRIDGGVITERSDSVDRSVGDDIIDCHGAVVLPGMVNGHTHLYSALAVGMPPPPAPPQNFLEILEFVWWRLDQALDAQSIEINKQSVAGIAVARGQRILSEKSSVVAMITGNGLKDIQGAIHAVGGPHEIPPEIRSVASIVEGDA